MNMKQQVIDAWVEAYTSLYPTEPLDYTETSDGVTLENGMSFTLSELKVNTAKLRAQLGQPIFTQFADPEEDRQELVQAIKSGNQGNLLIGKFLQKRYERGRTKLHNLEQWLLEQGLRLPAEGTRSKYRQAYESWVRNAGLELGKTYTHESFKDDKGNLIPMTLQGVSTYVLYEARNIVKKENAVEMLAKCYSSTLDAIKDAASNANKALEPMEEVRSLPKVPKSVYEAFSELLDAFPGHTKLEVIEFMIQFINDLQHTNKDVFTQAVAAYFGEAE